MRFTAETPMNTISAKKKVPVTRITTEARLTKDFKDTLKFYTPKQDYNDEGAILRYENKPLVIGYPVEDGKLRVICVENKESFGYAQQLKTVATRFDEKTLSSAEITNLINGLFLGYSNCSGQEEKVIRAIAWATVILKRDYREKFEKVDTEVSYSLELEDEDEKALLIEEMIKSVDMKRFMQMLSVAGSSDNYSKFANKEVAEQILKNWAEAKVSFYKMFGKKLWVEKEVDVQITSEEMNAFMTGIKSKFPKASFAIAQTRVEDWMNNSLHSSWNSYDTWRNIPTLTRDMKLSKAFASVFNDTSLDMAMSEALQNRTVKGKLRVSIDPYDYLTSSVNKHGWNSCHRITNGEYATGVFGYMCDNVSLLAYRTNSTEFDYEFFGFKFKGNSKAWRANVLFDLSSASFAIGRQYPSTSSELETALKDMLTGIVSAKYPTVKFGYIEGEFDNLIEDKNSLHYNDFLHGGHDKYLITPRDGTRSPSFMVGSPVLCVYCGKTVNNAGIRVSHSSCM